MTPVFSAQTALLQALSYGRGSGQNIARRVKEMTKGAIDIAPGSLYPAIKTLEKKGFVRALASGEYALTRFGQREADEQRALAALVFAMALKGREALAAQGSEG